MRRLITLDADMTVVAYPATRKPLSGFVRLDPGGAAPLRDMLPHQARALAEALIAAADEASQANSQSVVGVGS
jgi:hypothetical protein